MTLLISGIILWTLVHLFKSVTPGARAALDNKLSEKGAQGLAALLILASLAMIIFGWRSANYSFVYEPPVWGRHLHMTAMFFSVFLFGAANRPTRIKSIMPHPMLTGMIIWAGGHLLANGDSRSVVLFGGLGLWAIISIFTISARDKGKAKAEPAKSWKMDLIAIPITAVVYGVLFMTHRWYAGMPVMG